MQLSGTFLQSKIARRIALVIFLASFIPTVLVTVLAHRSITNITIINAHSKLVDTSKSYALFVFSNLINARNSLKNVDDNLILDASQESKLKHLNLNSFQSLKLINSDGVVSDEIGTSSYSASALQEILQDQTDRRAEVSPKLLVIPSVSSNTSPAVILLAKFVDLKKQRKLIAAELNPNYLWGEKESYPSDIRVCVGRLDGKSELPLFCSVSKDPKTNVEKTPESFADWELFMKGEFHDSNWRFETSRLYPLDKTSNYSFVSGYSYAALAVISLLLVAFLSLIQIRRTMGPLEQLIQATRRIARGQFQPVEVNRSNEFGELAEAFNGMSSDIERQLKSSQALALIDQEIASNLEVDKVIKQIIFRITQIVPSEFICISHILESNASEALCNVTISNNKIVSSARLSISNQEVELLKAHDKGVFVSQASEAHLLKQFFMEQGEQAYWILPILWQGEMCAFIGIGSMSPLEQNTPYWAELFELANRVGVAISAQEREHKLMVQAQYDSLTGLPNRVLLNDRIHQAIELSNRTNKPFWLAFVDMDKFKFINDSFGHNVGDQFLCDISRRLEQIIRGTDTVARFGGDEFIILLQANTNERAKNRILQRVMNSMAEIVNIEGHEIMTSCSIGVASYPNDALTPETLLTNADIALYRAKELGRNNIQEFNPVMNEQATLRLKMETHLRKALELEEFSVFYQPKVELKTNKMVGMEALIRWNNQSLGFVSPEHFISLAEETGLIISIGEWVLNTACKQAVEWQKAGYGNFLMSVNLSARQLADKNITKQISTVLEKTGLSANCLELELTESMIMEDTEETIAILKNIKSLGVQLSIDDFGTGYSSLSYLKNLPVDTLKIDKIFVDDIISKTSEAPIVASIIALAKNLKLKVVAEGVETLEQVSYLIAHGCDEVQGYFYSRPAPAELIEAKLKAAQTS